jgi:lysozyme family protein
MTQLRSPFVLPSATSERPGWSARGSGFNIQNDDDILNLILTWEGGFVSHPALGPFPFNAGISLESLSSFLGRQATLDELRGLSKDQIRAYYLQNFFKIDGVRQIENIVIKGAIINIMVLSGKARAVAIVQDALSQTSGRRILLDGVFGSVTSQLVNEIRDTDFFIETLNCNYWNYTKKLSSFDQFGRGWKRRILTFAPGKLQGVCQDLHS